MSDSKALISFRPAQLHSQGKEWYISYYVVNPATDKLHRRRHKINRIKPISERKRYANYLVDEINQKLYAGWNPYTEKEAPKGYTYLPEAFEIFYRAKERELRKESLHSYRSYINNFKKWLGRTGKESTYSVNFSRMDALDYMDYIFHDMNVSNTTWNNYLRFNRLVFAWMIERQYCVTNHFDQIKKKVQEQKQRVLIPEQDRDRIKEYLLATDYHFLVVCLLVFHALIRPKDITYLKPSSFNLDNQTIFIAGTFTKNKKDRVVTIPDALLPYISSWSFNHAQEDEFIFGTDFQPGKIPVNTRRLSKKWDALRKDLDLPKEMKLYSLRDSGIVQMLQDRVSPEEVMKQAGHSSLEITTIYAKIANPNGSAQIKQLGSRF